MEPVPGVDDAALAGRVTGELERRLDRLGAAVAEEHALQTGRLGQQLLPEKPHDRLAVKLRPRREVHGERVLQRLLDHGVRPPGREHPKPRQEIRVGVPLGVEEVGPLAAHVVLVEPNGVQRTRQLRVQVLAVQLVPLSTHGRELSAQIKAHWRILSAPAPLSPRQADSHVTPNPSIADKSGKQATIPCQAINNYSSPVRR